VGHRDRLSGAWGRYKIAYTGICGECRTIAPKCGNKLSNEGSRRGAIGAEDWSAA